MRPLIKPRLIGLITGLLAIAFAALVWVSNRQSFPAAPELASISLDLPKNPPPSKPLTELLTRRGISGLSKGVIGDALQAIKNQRWPKDAGAVLHALSGLNKPSLETFRKKLLHPGCLPPADNIIGVIQLNLWRLQRYIEYLALRAVALAQKGDVQRAMDELEALQRRLVFLQYSCGHTMGATMILERSLQRILAAWGFLLAVPESGGIDVQPRIWPMVRALATRTSPLPNALRGGHRFSTGVARLTENSWPGFDKKATLQVLGQISRRLIWLAELPAAGEALTRPTPEERFFDQLNNTPRWRLLLRYNLQGLLATSVEVFIVRTRINKWHLLRCHAAGRHTLWMADIQRRGRPLAPAAMPPPKNPFTGSPFGEELHRSDLPSPCIHPREPDPPKGPVGITPLPPAPPAHL